MSWWPIKVDVLGVGVVDAGDVSVWQLDLEPVEAPRPAPRERASVGAPSG